MKHKSNNLTRTRILTIMLLGFILWGCSTNNEPVKKKLQSLTENYFNSTNRRPNIDSIKVDKISDEIYNDISNTYSNSKILKILESKNSEDDSLIYNLIYKYSFPIAYNSRHIILNNLNLVGWLKDSINDSFQPTDNDYRKAETILLKGLKSEKEKYSLFLDSINIRNYYRQYVFFSKTNGDSMVYVNGFCELLKQPVDSCNTIIWKPIDWKKTIVIVEDGGDCYWRILINLTKKNFDFFMINGEA